jgi:hypothetical protein
MVTVEFLNGSVKLVPLLSLHQQFSDLGASREILRPNFSDFPLLGRFPLGMRWTKCILGKLSLVLIQGSLGLSVPYLTFIMGKVLPSETNDLRQSAVICLDLGGNVLALNE